MVSSFKGANARWSIPLEDHNHRIICRLERGVLGANLPIGQVGGPLADVHTGMRVILASPPIAAAINRNGQDDVAGCSIMFSHPQYTVVSVSHTIG